MAEEKNIAFPISAVMTANTISTVDLRQAEPPKVIPANVQIQTFHRLESDSPIYGLVGQVASDWAGLEHVLDIIIWNLAEVQPHLGACLTAQMMGHAPRCDAIIALATYRKFPPDLIDEVDNFKNSLFSVSNPRNRIIHDPWIAIATADSEGRSVESGQYKSMARKELKCGANKADIDAIQKLIEKIQQKRDDASELRNKINAALINAKLSPSPGRSS